VIDVKTYMRPRNQVIPPVNVNVIAMIILLFPILVLVDRLGQVLHHAQHMDGQ
jgi:hypothetical protein